MRTTLTLDDDVAAILRRLRKAGTRSLKELVNEGLRAGLAMIGAPRRRRKPFRTVAADLGPPRVGSLDNVADVLSVAEGESRK
jgi:hypothetical protein